MAARSRTLVVGLFMFALAASACDLPSLREARETAQALPETSFIYSEDGTFTTALHAGENRVVVRSRKIPDVVRNAVIAIVAIVPFLLLLAALRHLSATRAGVTAMFEPVAGALVAYALLGESLTGLS